MNMNLRAVGALFLAIGSPLAAQNLILNGDFENNHGLGQLGNGTSAQGWTSGATSGGGIALNFIANGTSDSSLLWGPASGSANGFNGSPNGGYFVALNGEGGPGALSQTINGLTMGEVYTLSFEWAAAQQQTQIVQSQQSIDIIFGSSAFSTDTINLLGKGFSGWNSFSTTFVADGSSVNLSLRANQSMPWTTASLTLIDGVSLQLAPVPEPSSYAAIGALALAGFAVARRSRRSR